MGEADSQVLTMEQDPEDVLLKAVEEIEIKHEKLEAGDGVQAVVELDKAADVELQEAEVVQVDDVQAHTAEVAQMTEMLQEDQVIQALGNEGHSGEWMQDGKSLDG